MNDATDGNKGGPEGSDKLFKAIEPLVISTDDARHSAKQYLRRARKAYPNASEAEQLERASRAIVEYYARASAVVGATTAGAGALPGAGTVAAMLGGGAVDAVIVTRLQIDMCMCLVMLNSVGAMTDQQRRAFAFLLALGALLEKAGVAYFGQAGAKMSANLIRKYLTGSTLLIIKRMFAVLGITFTKKGALKAIPFGVGVAVSSGVNYGSTKFVGLQAMNILRDFIDADDDGGEEQI